MSTEIKQPDWRQIDVDVAKLILSQGETYLKAQMQFALDADKRALAIAASSSAFSTALLAASIVAYNAKIGAGIVAACAICSFWVLLASLSCFYAARPIRFKIPGSEPKVWWPVADGHVSGLIGSETKNYQDRIEANAQYLSTNSTFTKIGMFLFGSTPYVFLVIYCALLS